MNISDSGYLCIMFTVVAIAVPSCIAAVEISKNSRREAIVIECLQQEYEPQICENISR